MMAKATAVVTVTLELALDAIWGELDGLGTINELSKREAESILRLAFRDNRKVAQ